MPELLTPDPSPSGESISDQVLSELLGGCEFKLAKEFEQALRLWQVERRPGEDLACFLIHNGLAPRLLESCRGLLHPSRLRFDKEQLWVRNSFPDSVQFADDWFGSALLTSEPLEVFEYPLPAIAFTSTLLNSEVLKTYLQDTNPQTARHHSQLTKPDDESTKLVRANSGTSSPRGNYPTQITPAARSSEVPGQDSPASSGRPLPQAGDTVGRCLLVAEVGRGASGLVYQAIHQKLQIPVAVKILTSETSEQTHRLRELLKSEARLLAQLNHPNVVRVFDFEDEGDLLYVILEFVEGLDLSNLLTLSGCVTVPRALRIVSQVASGLNAAARLGIIHRDVKPANILISRDDTAKVADLGLGVTVTGSAGVVAPLVGTVAYMSPEQGRCDPRIDHRSDIYSLGATLYHALTGVLPFTGQSSAEVLMKHAREDAVPPSIHIPDIPPEVDAIVLKMMAKDPKDRPQTYDELQALLASFAGSGSGVIRYETAITRTDILSTHGSPGKDSKRWSLFRMFRQKPAPPSPRSDGK